MTLLLPLSTAILAIIVKRPATLPLVATMPLEAAGRDLLEDYSTIPFGVFSSIAFLQDVWSFFMLK